MRHIAGEPGQPGSPVSLVEAGAGDGIIATSPWVRCTGDMPHEDPPCRCHRIGRATGLAAPVGSAGRQPGDRAHPAPAGIPASSIAQSRGGFRRAARRGGLVGGGCGDLHAWDHPRGCRIAGRVSPGRSRLSPPRGAVGASPRRADLRAQLRDGRQCALIDLLQPGERRAGGCAGRAGVSLARAGAAGLDRW